MLNIIRRRRETRLKPLLEEKAICCYNNERSSMLCLQAVMSSACITNAWCVIARFNEFENTLNYSALPQRKQVPSSSTG